MSALLFLALAYVLLGGRIEAASGATFVWFAVFGVVGLGGLVWNHVSATRSIRRARAAILGAEDALRRLGARSDSAS